MGIGKGTFVADVDKKSIKDGNGTIIQKDCFLELFEGCVIPIDVSIYGYVYMYTSRKTACRYVDLIEEDLDPLVLRSFWLEEYFDMIIAMIESGITPVPCMDGKPFRLKNNTSKDRVDKFNKEEDEIKSLRGQLKIKKDPKLYKKLEQKIASHVVFSSEDWEALIRMFKTMGLTVIHEDYEAEAVASRLCTLGLATAIMTKDSDCLTHGAPIMIRKITKRYVRGKPEHRCEIIIRDNVLKTLGLNDDQFIDFCVLIETDYNKRIKGYGFGKGLKLIKDHGNLDDIIEFLSAKKDLSEYRLNDEALRVEIRGYFTNELDMDLEPRLVVNYQNGLMECFGEIFNGLNRKRMIESCGSVVKKLKAFNQKFAKMKKFVLVNKSDRHVK